MYKDKQLINKTSEGNIAENTQEKIKNTTKHFGRTCFNSKKECLNVPTCKLSVAVSHKQIETARYEQSC